MGRRALLFALASVALLLSAKDPPPSELVGQGAELTVEAAAALEAAVSKKPNDERSRWKLLGFYTFCSAVPPEQARAGRAEHIVWMIGNRPKSEALRAGFSWFKIYRAGDPLADPESFERAKRLWLDHIESKPKDDDVKRAAAAFLDVADPEASMRLYLEVGEGRSAGGVAAHALLGVTSRDYRTGRPTGLDARAKSGPADEELLADLLASDDAAFLGGAGATLSIVGSALFADGLIDWDCTGTAAELLNGSIRIEPTADYVFRLALLTPPRRGLHPPPLLAVGGAIQRERLLHSVVPQYPLAAKTRQIEGVVKLSALVGLDGSVERLIVESGPSELVESAVEAVRQWKYRPTTLSGRRCYVITRIDVNYSLRR